MGWFKRKLKGVMTPTTEKKETPEGLWYKCPKCKNVVSTEDHSLSLHVCKNCGYHDKIGSAEYFKIIFDDNKFKELDANLSSSNPLNFEDTKKYSDRIVATQKKTNLKDAVRTAVGKVDNQDLVVACMDFDFIGGSMGSVVGEKIARAIDYSLKHRVPFLMISKSGGARMMEAAFSLMQMAKTRQNYRCCQKQKFLIFRY